MQDVLTALGALFGPDGELRQIIGVTLGMACCSTLISALIGMPLGALLGSGTGRFRRWFLRLTQTLMGLPPVVAGLVVFLLLSRSGPLGSLRLLYSVAAMVIAQVVLLTPLICGMTASLTGARAGQLKETCLGFGAGRLCRLALLLWESRRQLVSVLMLGFGRAVAEVGAVQIVGGNVQYKTRVMTTAIMLETNKGNFGYAVALGVVLLVIALAVNTVAHRFQEERHE